MSLAILDVLAKIVFLTDEFCLLITMISQQAVRTSHRVHHQNSICYTLLHNGTCIGLVSIDSASSPGGINLALIIFIQSPITALKFRLASFIVLASL